MDTVFGNMDRLLESHRHTLSLLQGVQYEQWPVVHSIASIIGDLVQRTAQVYETYVANYPIAQYYIDREAEGNRQFRKFLKVSVHITLYAKGGGSPHRTRTGSNSSPWGTKARYQVFHI